MGRVIYYKAVVTYDGAAACGFASQPNVQTVQSTLLNAISRFFRDVSHFTVSGRTDSGVHSEHQLIGFSASNAFDLVGAVRGLNSILPAWVCVRSITRVSGPFIARKQTSSRQYQYLFSNQWIPLWLRHRIVSIRFQPRVELFPVLSGYLMGTHDFANFQSSGSVFSTTVRTVFSCHLESVSLPSIYHDAVSTQFYRFVICANSFLYRMIRHIVGAMFEVLSGKELHHNFYKMLHNPANKPYSYSVAPSLGLSLTRVYEIVSEGKSV